jgi:uncharacterized protein YkwD
MKYLHAWAFMAAATLAACGGGGDDDAAAVESQTSTAASNPSVPPATAGSTGATASSATANLCGTTLDVAEIVAKINAARTVSRGCGFANYAAAAPLAWNAKLAVAADAHSLDMASHSLFSHTGSNGSSVADRVSAAGYGWWMVGENIAGGQANASDAINVWLGSPEHCANLMNPGYKDVALACGYAAGSAYQRYWTLVLAAQN